MKEFLSSQILEQLYDWYLWALHAMKCDKYTGNAQRPDAVEFRVEGQQTTQTQESHEYTEGSAVLKRAIINVSHMKPFNIVLKHLQDLYSITVH